MAYRSRHGVNDLILLDSPSNDSILDCLRTHFLGDEIYTFVGQVLISVNPFKQISGLYDSPNKFKHKNEHQNPPHIFAVAERAYRSMVQNLTQECIIITGESGAGNIKNNKQL
jgi:myosin-1